MRSDDEVKAVLTVFHDVWNDLGRNVGNIDDFIDDVFRSMFRKENDEFLLRATFCE